MLTKTVTRVPSHARLLTDDKKFRSHDTAWAYAVWSVHGSVFWSVLSGSPCSEPNLLNFEVDCGQYGNHKLITWALLRVMAMATT